MKKELSRLWSRKEVASYFGVSELTVLRLIQSGAITAYKVKGQWKFKKEDIDQFLEERSNRTQRKAGNAASKAKKN